MRFWRKGTFYEFAFGSPPSPISSRPSFDLLKPYPDGIGLYPERKFASFEELRLFCEAALGESDLREVVEIDGLEVRGAGGGF